MLMCHLLGNKPLPNERLKLTAPGCWRNCVCAPANFVVRLHFSDADERRRRSLSTVR